MRSIDQTATFVVLALLALLTPGCAESGFGDFDGEVVGQASCLDDFLPFESNFQSAQDQATGSSFYFQSASGVIIDKDFIYIGIFEEEGPVVGNTYVLEPAGVEGSQYVAQIGLGKTCPDALVSYYIDGEVTFTAYERENGGDVTGAIAGNVMNTETNEVVVQGFEGSWDFSYERGPPYEPFP